MEENLEGEKGGDSPLIGGADGRYRRDLRWTPSAGFGVRSAHPAGYDPDAPTVRRTTRPSARARRSDRSGGRRATRLGLPCRAVGAVPGRRLAEPGRARRAAPVSRRRRRYRGGGGLVVTVGQRRGAAAAHLHHLAVGSVHLT